MECFLLAGMLWLSVPSQYERPPRMVRVDAIAAIGVYSNGRGVIFWTPGGTVATEKVDIADAVAALDACPLKPQTQP